MQPPTLLLMQRLSARTFVMSPTAFWQRFQMQHLKKTGIFLSLLTLLGCGSTPFVESCPAFPVPPANLMSPPSALSLPSALSMSSQPASPTTVNTTPVE